MFNTRIICFKIKHKRKLNRYNVVFCVLLCLIVIIFSLNSKLLATTSKTRHISCRCGVYTPYHLTAGGGEKMILSFVKVLHQITSCHVDLVVQRNNVCTNINCLKRLASMLSVVGLDWDRVKFRYFSPRTMNQEKLNNQRYLIWIHMSNSLLPSADDYGHFNVFHSQFPFDGLETPQNIHSLKRLEKYQSVYLNSHYTLSWYEKFLERENKLYTAQGNYIFCFPGLTHFTPPFDFEFKEKKGIDFEKPRHGVKNIILVGRFFEGIQSKRQLEAIEAFNRISKIRKDVKLYLCGFMATGQEAYVKKIKRAALLNPNVILKIGASSKELEEAQLDSLVVWSITGIESSTRNPADAEHFGIGLLEAMSRGIIPIVINKGGPVEIVSGLSFKSAVSSLDELVASTLSVLDAKIETLQSMQKEVLLFAHSQRGVFESSFASIFTVIGLKLSPGKENLWRRLVIQMKTSEMKYCNSRVILPMESKKVALYVENRHDSSLRANVYRLMNSLGPSWGLRIVHSSINEHYFKTLLNNIENVQFKNMEHIFLPKAGQGITIDKKGNEDPFDPRNSAGLYNPMWKSSLFWNMLGDIDTVFTFQSDSWFLHNMKQSIVETYDYIGSPWCLEGNAGFLSLKDRPKNVWHMLHDTRQIDMNFRVGNGGISLRSFKAIKAIIDQHGGDTPAQENEDVFFVHYLHKDGYQIAGKSDAARFGLECFCDDIPLHNELVELWFWLLEKDNKDYCMKSLSKYVFFMHKPEIVYLQLADKYVRSLHPRDVNEQLFEKMMDVFVEFFMN